MISAARHKRPKSDFSVRVVRRERKGLEELHITRHGKSSSSRSLSVEDRDRSAGARRTLKFEVSLERAIQGAIKNRLNQDVFKTQKTHERICGTLGKNAK
jgi:hypothetical protein